MSKTGRRTPRGYDGTKITSRPLGAVLTTVLKGIEKKHGSGSDRVMSAWPRIVGSKVALMTKTMSFDDGVLHVKVKNSTLLTLLARSEKHRLLNELRQQFPGITIQDIKFRLG